jgi:hypothetical protein
MNSVEQREFVVNTIIRYYKAVKEKKSPTSIGL